MGKKGKKGKKLPQKEEVKVPEGQDPHQYCISPEETSRLLLDITRNKSTFHSNQHAAVLTESRLCISTTFPHLPLIEVQALAEVANTVNMLGVGSFWTKVGEDLVIRTSSVLAPGLEDQESQIRRMVDRHNENLRKDLAKFLG